MAILCIFQCLFRCCSQYHDHILGTRCMVLSGSLRKVCATYRLLRILIGLIHRACPYSAAHLHWRKWLTRSNLLLFKPQELILFCHCLWKCHNILLGLPSDMCNGILHDLDSTLPIVGNDIASNIWLTMRSKDNDTIKSTLFNLVPPNQRHRSSFVIVSDNLYTVFM